MAHQVSRRLQDRSPHTQLSCITVNLPPPMCYCTPLLPPTCAHARAFHTTPKNACMPHMLKIQTPPTTQETRMLTCWQGVLHAAPRHDKRLQPRCLPHQLPGYPPHQPYSLSTCHSEPPQAWHEGQGCCCGCIGAADEPGGKDVAADEGGYHVHHCAACCADCTALKAVHGGHLYRRSVYVISRVMYCADMMANALIHVAKHIKTEAHHILSLSQFGAVYRSCYRHQASSPDSTWKPRANRIVRL